MSEQSASSQAASLSAPIRLEQGNVVEVRGPLVMVKGVQRVGWDELAEVSVGGEPREPRQATEVRHAMVLEVHRDTAVLQVLEGTEGIVPERARVAFAGHTVQIAVGPGWLGRVCSGRGDPLDGGPPISGSLIRDVNGYPINPTKRVPPSEPVVTGVSAIDALMTLVRGQKLPIFSVAGLPHLELAAQIGAQATTANEPFSVVFAAMGLPRADADAVRARLEERLGEEELVLLLNTAQDPVIERLLTPRVALTVAEHLAFEMDRHVLVILADMTSYAEAVREVSAARGEIPGRHAYPGYLYSDLASIYERCGRVQGKRGSVTVIPVLTMPAGDITHPVPDLTGYITEGQIVLSSELHSRGVYPPVEALGSLSRLMRSGAGEGRTREDHLPLVAQILAALARARQARDISETIGAEALSGTDQSYLELAEAFEKGLVSQGHRETRGLDDTLDRCWDVLRVLPPRELTMMPKVLLDAHLSREG